MATITRTQHVQYFTTPLPIAVEGKGTTKFLASNAPNLAKVKTMGTVLSGQFRITRLASGEGYNIVRIGKGSRNADRRRVFYRADAAVVLGGHVLTVERLYNALGLGEDMGLSFN